MKNKIIDTARKLYNNQGIKPVTARMICTELNISPGSFSYHFPDKSKIIEILYFNMLVEQSTITQAMPIEALSITGYLKSLNNLFAVQYRYRFFFLHLFEIMTQYPKIKESYDVNLKKNKESMHETLELYAANGIIKKSVTTVELNELVQIEQALTKQWVVNSSTMTFGSKKEKFHYYLRVCSFVLEPYLTKKSLKEYRSFFKGK